MSGIIIEACIETLKEAIYAQEQGATRLELCGRLDLDGLTPKLELIEKVMNSTDLPVKVMLRHRGGDFHYDEADRKRILEEYEQLLDLGVTEMVFGAVCDHRLDMDLIKELCVDPRLKGLTIHKAIDTVEDPVMEVRRIIKELPYNELNLAILTSGGKETAREGIEVINNMSSICDGKVEVIAAGRITKENLSEIMALAKTTSFHGRRIV